MVRKLPTREQARLTLQVRSIFLLDKVRLVHNEQWKVSNTQGESGDSVLQVTGLYEGHKGVLDEEEGEGAHQQQVRVAGGEGWGGCSTEAVPKMGLYGFVFLFII